MPLNYSKWDQLELSDDSDIEGHPNVDKKSLIRWKQRDIHEKREVRKHRINHLHAQIACNNVLLPRIKDITARLEDPSASPPATVYFNSLVEQLTTKPSPDCPPGNDPTKLEQTYDGMLLSLLRQVSEDAKAKFKDGSRSDKDEKIAKELTELMSGHVKHLGETIKKDEQELEKEEHEQKKHITSDDIHEGFESKYVPPKPEPPPVPHSRIDAPKEKKKVTEYEVLNPKASASPADAAELEEDEEDAGLPELTPSLEAFSKLPLHNYEQSFHFIQAHRDVYVSGASDALLVAAFQAQSEGKSKYAKQCVHQSLLLQYCEKLGRDGVGVFFRKMISGDKKAEKVFVEDVENTYNHLVNRVRISQEEQAQSLGKEQIQLVAENPDTEIRFNVPDGPPPQNIVLEGPGTEGMNIEEVKKALQFRWEVFQGFPAALQEALRDGGLDKVNKVLGDMDVAEAEGIVTNLDLAGILSFAEGGIRDETGASAA